MTATTTKILLTFILTSVVLITGAFLTMQVASAWAGGSGGSGGCCDTPPPPQEEPDHNPPTYEPPSYDPPSYNPPPNNPPPQHKPAPYCSINDDPPYVDYGGSVTMTWTSSNATSATLTNAGSVSVNGSKTFHNITQETRYVLTVTGPGGTATCDETVKVKEEPKKKPFCTLTINPSKVDHGGNATISWDSTHASSATLTSFGSVNVDGSRSLSNIKSNKTYTLTVSGPGGSATCQDSVQVKEAPKPAPNCSINDNPPFVEYGGSVTMTWTSNNATSATLTNAGAVSVNGSKTFHNITQNTEYVLVVKGPGGQASCTETVKVKQQPEPNDPWCAIWASPQSIQQNGSSKLEWTSGYANSASINQGIGSVSLQGSRTVSPGNTKTYTMTVTGDGGTATCQTTITVEQAAAPWCSLWASPSTIQQGNSSQLEWDSGNATSATLTDYGSVSVDGSRTVSPNNTKTYTLTVKNNAGQTATCQTTVHVQQHAAPSCSIWANPSNVTYGGNTTVTWDSTNATSASLTDAGSVNLDGSRTFSNITDTRTFTLTVWNNQGQSNTCQTTVHTNQQQNLSCNLNIYPSSIQKGNTATMQWSSNNATHASIDSLGSVGTQGSTTISPTYSKTYTMTVWNNQGATNTCTAHITVTEQPSDNLWCTIAANPTNIGSNGSSNLTWQTSSTATSAQLSDGIGYVSTGSGNLTVRPENNRTYVLTVRDNQGHQQTCSTTVRVDGSPYVSLTSVPYTGFGDHLGSILGMAGALAVALSAVILLTSYRRELFGTIDALVSRRA